MKTDSTTLEAKIAEIKAQHQAQAEREIEIYKLSFEVDGARKSLSQKFKAETNTLEIEVTKLHKDLKAEQAKEITAFESKYGVSFEIKPATPKKKSYSTNAKAKMISELVIDGKPKYQYKDGVVVGVKGEPVTSTIVFKDSDKNKQTLAVSAYAEWCKENSKDLYGE
jgi:hypothetical protein